MAKRKKRDSDLDALNKMMLNVLQQKRKRRREVKKSQREESELWEDFDIADDVADAEDDY
jgi:hypothetical protein